MNLAGGLGDWLSQPLWWLVMHSTAGGGRAGGVLRVWTWWEHRYLRHHHVTQVEDGSVLRFEVRHHRGPTVALADGTRVHRGDRIVELHLANNTVAPDVDTPGWSPFQVITSARGDLEILARLVTTGRLGSVVALHAVSLIAPALARLGFEVVPLESTLRNRLLHFYLVGLLAVYHPDGWKAAGRARRGSWPSEAWISARGLTNIGS
ncbi:MAG TPA: hypothetical protein VND54_02685 [Candidatus Saccharimonadales bacterium]|nr:hypothetical protein [Candidatus Saccharimonadales bacterium]